MEEMQGRLKRAYMMKRRGRIKDYYIKEYIICCAISFVPKLVMILTAAYPLYNPGDELYIFYIPAKLAGLDWASSMNTYRYYGYGFSIFLIPLFKNISDAVLLYRIVLIMVAIIQLIIPIICCYLLRSFFNIKNKIHIILITTICTFKVAVSNTYMYNEHIYIVWVWISFFILAKLWQSGNDRKKKIIYSFMLGISFLGALTVHQRAITLFMAFLILYVVIKILLKKSICYLLPVVGTYTVGNYINTKIMDYFIRMLKYGNNLSVPDLSKIQNRSINISLSWKMLQDEDYIQAAIKTIIGNLNNWNISTVGVGVFSIVLGIYFIILIYQKKFGEEQKKLFYFGVFGVAAIFITIAGLAVSWGWGIKAAYCNNDSTSDSLRGLIYLRYLLAYYPPVLLGVLAYLCSHMEIYIKLFRYTISVSGFLCFYYLAEIMPLMKNEINRFGALIIYSLNQFNSRGMIPADYFIAIGIFLIVIFLAWILIKNKKIVLFLILMCTLSGWNYVYSTYLVVGKSSKINYQYVDQYNMLINKLSSENIDIPIYVYAGGIKETKHGLLFEVQFVNMDEKFYRGFPEEDLAEAMYFTSYPEEAEYLIENGYQYIQLDEEEHIYVKGERVIKYIEEYLENY